MVSEAITLPKIYRLDRWKRAYTIGCGLVLGVGMPALVAWYSWDNGGVAADFATIFFLFLSLLGFASAWIVAKAKTVLYDDRIEVVTAFARRLVMADDISAYRDGRAPEEVALIGRDLAAKPLYVPRSLLNDGAALSWLHGLKNISLGERKVERAALMEDVRLGTTQVERDAFVRRMRIVVPWLNGVGVAAGVWGLVYPRPYGSVIAALALLPIIGVAVMVWARPLIRIDGRAHDARLTLDGLFFLPGIILLLRALLDIALLDWTWPIAIALGGGALAMFALTLIDATLKARGWSLFAAGVVSASYLFGAIVEADVQFDPSAAQRFETTVRDKHTEHGKVTTYKLTVGSWGPNTADNDVQVWDDLYEHAQAGERICVYLKGGLFGWSWYTVGACE